MNTKGDHMLDQMSESVPEFIMHKMDFDILTPH